TALAAGGICSRPRRGRGGVGVVGAADRQEGACRRAGHDWTVLAGQASPVYIGCLAGAPVAGVPARHLARRPPRDCAVRRVSVARTRRGSRTGRPVRRGMGRLLPPRQDPVAVLAELCRITPPEPPSPSP